MSFGRFLLIVILILLGTLIVTQRNLPTAGSGWVAKRACSALFVSGRSLATSPEVFPPVPVPTDIPVEVDEDARTVTSRFMGRFAPSVARYREGLGCTLDPADGTPEALGDRRIAPRPSPAPLLEAPGNPAIEAAIDFAFEQAHDGYGTRALVAIHRGRIVGERYADGFDRDTRLTGWSANKSITSAVVGLLVDDGRIQLHDAIGLPEWSAPDDPRRVLTWDHLLRMSSGLAFSENYLIPSSDAIQMLFGAERGARGRYAASLSLEHPIDTHWSYSSGTTNILQYAMLERVFAGDLDAYLRFPHERLFGPAGMSSAILEPDASGVYVGSSHGFMTARDWARFGLLFLNEGRVGDRVVLSPEWVRYSATPTPTNAEGIYGAQWWLNADPAEGERRMPRLAPNIMIASGFEGQYVFVVPDDDLVVARLGLDLDERVDIEKIVADIAAAVRTPGKREALPGGRAWGRRGGRIRALVASPVADHDRAAIHAGRGVGLVHERRLQAARARRRVA